MKTVKFRVRNPIKWLAPLISTVYLIGVVFLCIQNFKFLLILTAGSRFLFLLVLAPAVAPLFLLLWLLSPARQVRMVRAGSFSPGATTCWTRSPTRRSLTCGSPASASSWTSSIAPVCSGSTSNP